MVMPHMRTIALVFGGAFTLVAPIVIGVATGNVGFATLVALCGAFVTLLAKLDDLVELSLGPVKAKMRETLMEAAATVEQLRGLAVVSAAAQLAALAEAFFGWANGNRERLVQLRDEIVTTLRKLGVPEADIHAAETPWRKSMGCVYHRFVIAYINRADLRNGVVLDSEAQKAALIELKGAMDFDSRSAASPEQLEEVLKRHGLLTSELVEWLNDYKSFVKTGTIPRPSVFGDR